MSFDLADIVSFTIVGLVIGSAYAIAASGLVITYATSNVFNIAHGAIGMVMAFLYWELHENRGLPTLLALFLVVGVAAPLFGALIERTMMRRLTSATVTVSLTVTVGLLVALIGFAQSMWPPAGRSVDRFFASSRLRLGEVTVTVHDILTFAIALVVAISLFIVLNRTRTGTAMRAIVDNRTLVALHGARPGMLGMTSWALGSSLAALAGILLVPVVSLDYLQLTLLVISAYAAAMVGRLTNLPRTFVGAMILGLLQAYFLMAASDIERALSPIVPKAWDLQQFLGGVRAALPTLFLFITMLVLPQEKLRVGQIAGASLVKIPTWRRTLLGGAALVGAVVLVTAFVSGADSARIGRALALAIIMLSLVVLTGYGGEVSLGQMTFVGIGALVVSKMFQGDFGIASLVVGGLIAGAAGALVALPALRLRGLYLALGTLAFAAAMDKLVFEFGAIGFRLGGSGARVRRPTLFGISLEGERAYAILLAVAFVALAAVVVAIRRGRFGRFLLALRDSPVACGTLGLSITTTRVLVFAVSAAMAGVGGVLYSGQQVSVGATDFAMFQSLPILLLAVVGGVTSITGALIGGAAIGLLPIVQDRFPGIAGIVFLSIGAAAIALGRNPNGIAGMAFQLFDRRRREREEDERAITPGGSGAALEGVSVGAAP